MRVIDAIAGIDEHAAVVPVRVVGFTRLAIAAQRGRRCAGGQPQSRGQRRLRRGWLRGSLRRGERENDDEREEAPHQRVHVRYALTCG